MENDKNRTGSIIKNKPLMKIIIMDLFSFLLQLKRSLLQQEHQIMIVIVFHLHLHQDLSKDHQFLNLKVLLH